MAPCYRIGIVGFGMAGAAAAVLLARAGHRIELFERAPQVGPVGAGVLLMPSGQMVLERLGLLEETVRQGEPIEELHAVKHRGGTLMRMPFSVIEPGCRAYGMHRGELFEVLHREVVRHPIAVHLSHEVRSYRRAGKQVFVCAARSREHGPFDFLIAADGSRSLLRDQTRLTRWLHEYAYGALWTIGHCRAIRGKLHQVVRGTHNLLGLLPMGAGRCSLFWSLRKDAKDAVWKAGFPAWRAQVLELCPQAEELFERLTSFQQVAFTTYQHVWMHSWYNEQVLFLGDAAHAMSPHLGQGINLALLDAYRFSELLPQARTPLQAFRRYTEDRRDHLRYYATVTLLLTPFFQSSGWLLGLGRDLVLPWLPCLPWLRRQMALTMGGVKRSFLGGKIQL
jgi:2-polyprenyl-6-methoxyphenol hydroxylase-like FAD-dependent oxidoreductase